MVASQELPAGAGQAGGTLAPGRYFAVAMYRGDGGRWICPGYAEDKDRPAGAVSRICYGEESPLLPGDADCSLRRSGKTGARLLTDIAKGKRPPPKAREPSTAAVFVVCAEPLLRCYRLVGRRVAAAHAIEVPVHRCGVDRRRRARAGGHSGDDAMVLARVEVIDQLALCSSERLHCIVVVAGMQ